MDQFADKIHDIFISHTGADSQQALELSRLLKSRDPDLDIFLDCEDNHPLQEHEEWLNQMMKDARNSRYMIFLASRPEFLEEGYCWVYPEVLTFAKASKTRKKEGRTDLTVSWFGILLDGCPFRTEMFTDPKHGEEYRLMYEDKEHLCLEPGTTMADAEALIWEKFRKMYEGGSNTIAHEVLKKVHSFAQEADATFRPEAICEGLIPKLLVSDPREGESKLMDSQGLIDLLQTNSLVLLGTQGGSGKTSLLTKLFYHHLPSLDDASFFTQPGGMIPLYVDAKTLAGKDHLILRHLARTLYNDATAVTSEFTSEAVSKLSGDFAQARPQPRYLLLIDGYNEIPARVLDQFNEELTQYLPGGHYKNVRVLIASRHMSLELPEDVRHLRLGRLSNPQIVTYLRDQGCEFDKLPAKLMEILSTPMYLKLYAQTSADGGIDSKGDLLAAFVEWQQKKDEKTARSQGRKALAYLLLKHYLPLLAYRLAAASSGDPAFIFDEDMLLDISEECLELLEDPQYQRYYGRTFRAQTELGLAEVAYKGKPGYNSFLLADMAQEYFVENCKLLRQEEDDSFVFVHQIYRDFFCAWYVTESLKRTDAAKVKEAAQILLDDPLPEDVEDFVADLLQEGRPFCTPGVWTWNYECNNNSLLLRLLDHAKTLPEGQNQAYIANLVNLLKRARENDLSGCDFSGLDLRGCDLRTCVLNRWDAQSTYPASFTGAWLDRENLICDSHLTRITAGCVGNGRVATLDRSGELRIWVLPSISGVSEKIISQVDPRVEKLLYAPTGDRIYAMTPHEILELPIPQERESVAQPRVLLETTKRLRSILLDEQGQLCFTTVFNSFNPKPVTDPEAPDIRDFYGLNSAAAVNSTGTQLAFGHVADEYTALRIYNYDAQKDAWVEQKFGYYLLLDGFMAELVQTLKELELYDQFPDDFAPLREAGEDVPELGSYFEFTRRQFYDRNHALDKAPRIIYEKRIVNRLTLTPEQQERLEAVVDTWAEKIRNKTREDPLIMGIVGRRVEELHYKGEDHLLISCVNEYDNPLNKKERVKNTIVVEINTKTMETRYISNYVAAGRKATVLKATYWEGGLLLFSGNLLTVQDQNTSQIARVRVYETDGGAFIPLIGEGFLVVAEHFVYQFDTTGRCVAAWDNHLPPAQKNLSYVMDENGRDFLIRTSRLRFCHSGSKEEVLDISTGSSHRLAFPTQSARKSRDSTPAGDILYKLYANRLTAFRTGVRIDSFSLPYKLFVQNCDFQGIRGTLAEENALLSRMGAITDPVDQPLCQSERVHLTPVPSAKPFTPPELQVHTPYIRRPELQADAANEYDTPLGGEHLSALKIWTRIYEGTYSRDGLEAADMSILEWTGRLAVVTPEMIGMLIRGGMVEPPVGYEQTKEALAHRLDKVLHSSYRLLRRHAFYRGEEALPHKWYALTGKFGVPLLYKIRSRLNKPEEGDYALRRQLALNHWFCRMVAAYPGQITRYAFNEEFESEGHCYSKATVHCYLQAGDQPVFVLATRRPFDVEREEKTKGMLEFLCRQVAYCRDLARNTLPEPVEKPPVVVIIGEDYAHCLHLNGLLGRVAPFVRKLYTYDALLHNDDAAPPVHFSFLRGQPLEENILDLR